ncbi:hypothetical protein KUV51_07745 [Tateyamaria omphalii]|uniref:hypothetical protein n=1 Tax=Tateyamaria omphalii TaxID=299262 RepID=UPI001C999AE4|nr:hypothetical protein [Tateyamaria omphalii]MBY5932884.1 hypothetical protein [Tateyamaria omphalii]
MRIALRHISFRTKGHLMQHPYKSLEMNSLYAQEQRVFAKLQAEEQIRKRKQRRRRALMWVLRRL